MKAKRCFFNSLRETEDGEMCVVRLNIFKFQDDYKRYNLRNFKCRHASMEMYM